MWDCARLERTVVVRPKQRGEAVGRSKGSFADRSTEYHGKVGTEGGCERTQGDGDGVTEAVDTEDQGHTRGSTTQTWVVVGRGSLVHFGRDLCQAR